MERSVKSFLKGLQTIKEEEKVNKIMEFREVFGMSSLIWILESDDKEGLQLIRGLISWLPQEIEGARVVLDILNELDEQPRIDEVVLMGGEFLCSLTKKLLGNLQEQIIEFTSRERVDVSQNLINDLLFLVRNNVFGTLFLDEFAFCVDSLVGIHVDPSDVSESIMYMQILEVVYRLPKENSTAGCFDTFMDNKLAVIASLCPVFLMEEHRWVLNLGSDFRRNLAYYLVPPVQGVIGHTIEVDRSDFLRISMDKLLAATPYNLRMGVSVKFTNEAGRGIGILRDWLLSLAHKMVNSEGMPFENSGEDIATDHTRIYPRRGSAVDPNFYRCFGRVMGLAIVHRVQIGYTLDKVAFLQLGGHTVTLEDIKEAVPCKYRYYKELFVMSKNALRNCYLFFTSDFEGSRVTSRGRVTVDNLDDYVALRIDLEFVNGIRSSISQMLLGLNDVLTDQRREHLFQVLKIHDFDIILRGIQELKVEEWKRFTTYDGYNQDDPQIIWFWDCVGDMSPQEQRNLLHFWTSRVWLPAGGFKDLDPPLVIRRVLRAGDSDLYRLPSARTCVCALSIPLYDSAEIMCSKLRTAIENCDSFELL